MNSSINEEGYDKNDGVLYDVEWNNNEHHVIELKILDEWINFRAHPKDPIVWEVHDLHIERQDGVDVHKGRNQNLKDEGNAKSDEDALKVPNLLVNEGGWKDEC